MTGDLVTLTSFDGFDEVGDVAQAVVGTGVEPGETAPEQLNTQVAALEIGLVDAGNSQLAAGRRLDRPGDIDDIVVVEVQPGDRIAAHRAKGFLFDRDGAPVGVELDHAEALGVFDPVAENGGALQLCRRLAQGARETLAVEDVVTEH